MCLTQIFQAKQNHINFVIIFQKQQQQFVVHGAQGSVRSKRKVQEHLLREFRKKLKHQAESQM